MRTISSSVGVAVLAVLLSHSAAVIASPPPVRPAPKVDERPRVEVKLTHRADVSWGGSWLEGKGSVTKSADGQQTFVLVRAVDVSSLESAFPRRDRQTAPTFEIYWQPAEVPGEPHSRVNVVDERVFTDLRRVWGKDAKNLDLDGLTIGQIKTKDYDPVEVVRFLIAGDILDVTVRLTSVKGAHYTSDAGDWFRLSVTNDYYTAAHVVNTYDIGVHITPDGTIRLVNPRYVGRLLK